MIINGAIEKYENVKYPRPNLYYYYRVPSIKDKIIGREYDTCACHAVIYKNKSKQSEGLVCTTIIA